MKCSYRYLACDFVNIMFYITSLVDNARNVVAIPFSFFLISLHCNDIFGILGQRQKGVIARSVLLRPGGPLACELARHAVVLRVDDWLFCHGGLLPHHGKKCLMSK